MVVSCKWNENADTNAQGVVTARCRDLTNNRRHLDCRRPVSGPIGTRSARPGNFLPRAGGRGEPLNSSGFDDDRCRSTRHSVSDITLTPRSRSHVAPSRRLKCEARVLSREQSETRLMNYTQCRMQRHRTLRYDHVGFNWFILRGNLRNKPYFVLGCIRRRA